jgi:hypothetical protein
VVKQFPSFLPSFFLFVCLFLSFLTIYYDSSSFEMTFSDMKDYFCAHRFNLKPLQPTLRKQTENLTNLDTIEIESLLYTLVICSFWWQISVHIYLSKIYQTFRSSYLFLNPHSRWH